MFFRFLLSPLANDKMSRFLLEINEIAEVWQCSWEWEDVVSFVGVFFVLFPLLIVALILEAAGLMDQIEEWNDCF